MPIEGCWANRVIGLDDVRREIAVLRTPDGHGRIELATFHTPKAIARAQGSADVHAGHSSRHTRQLDG
jgi:hypothetical protein